MKILTFVFLLIVSINSSACRCREISALDNFKSSDFVIVAKAIEVDPTYHYPDTEHANGIVHGNKAIFKVISIYKGIFQADSLVTIEGGVGSCSIDFFENETYLIYGKIKDNFYFTHMCDRTKPIKDNPDIEILNKK
jgi:hypothetical protein